jgi:hypothetical protein
MHIPWDMLWRGNMPRKRTQVGVVGQNPPTDIDRQHESREAQSLYPSALQLTRAPMMKFVGCAT